MTLTIVKPSALLPGDPVIIDNVRWVIRAIEGPDQLETYDLYLTGDCGDCHKIVRESVQIVISE